MDSYTEGACCDKIRELGLSKLSFGYLLENSAHQFVRTSHRHSITHIKSAPIKPVPLVNFGHKKKRPQTQKGPGTQKNENIDVIKLYVQFCIITFPLNLPPPPPT